MSTLRAWRKPLMIVGLSLGLLLFARQLWAAYAAVRLLGWGVFVRPWYLLLALAFSLLIYISQMAAWRWTLRCFGVSLGLGHTIEGFQLSFLPRYIPGSLWGYLSRSQWLEQFHGVSYHESLAASTMEIVTQVLTALAAGVVCYGLARTGAAGVGLSTAGVGLLAGVWLFAPRLVAFISRRVWRVSLQPTVAPGTWFRVIVAHTALWVMYGTSLLFVVMSLTTRPSITWWQATAAASFSWLVGFLVPFVPAGIGIREYTLSHLLAGPGMLTPAQANLASIVSRFGLVLAELTWVIIGLGFYAEGRRRRGVAKAKLDPPEHR